MVVSRSRITIDLDNFCHNVNYLKSSNNEKILCAVVKANAYGHGINIVAKKLLNLGVRWFAVSSVNEGIELRKIIGNSNCILIFPDFYANRWEEIERYNLIPVIHNFRSLDELAGSQRSHLKFHIEIDTGMSRTGFNSKDLPKLVSKLKGLHLDGLEGVYSHLASSEENNKAYTTKQLNLLQTACEYLRGQFECINYIHIENSAALFCASNNSFDLFRSGIALYGIEPISGITNNNLKPVLSWSSTPLQIFQLSKGESVSYECTWVAPKNSTIAVIPVGYADGYPRSASNKGYLLVNGCPAPIVGNICMDSMMIDISDCGVVSLESKVVLVGSQSVANVTIEDIATWANTISYEVICNIAPRSDTTYLGIE